MKIDGIQVKPDDAWPLLFKIVSKLQSGVKVDCDGLLAKLDCGPCNTVDIRFVHNPGYIIHGATDEGCYRFWDGKQNCLHVACNELLEAALAAAPVKFYFWDLNHPYYVYLGTREQMTAIADDGGNPAIWRGPVTQVGLSLEVQPTRGEPYEVEFRDAF